MYAVDAPGRNSRRLAVRASRSTVMYFAGLVAIGWMYVTLMMAITQPTFIAGIATFFFYGLLPVSIIVYVMLAP